MTWEGSGTPKSCLPENSCRKNCVPESACCREEWSVRCLSRTGGRPAPIKPWPPPAEGRAWRDTAACRPGSAAAVRHALRSAAAGAGPCRLPHVLPWHRLKSKHRLKVSCRGIYDHKTHKLVIPLGDSGTGNKISVSTSVPSLGVCDQRTDGKWSHPNPGSAVHRLCDISLLQVPPSLFAKWPQ